MAQGLIYMSENPGIYVVHCLEGKDRTGYFIAILECLMSASYDEIVSDYMVTYYNYYGIESTDERYETIYTNNIVKSLEKSFDVKDLKTSNLSKETEEFLQEIGLNNEQISALKTNLSGKAEEYADTAEESADNTVNITAETADVSGEAALSNDTESKNTEQNPVIWIALILLAAGIIVVVIYIKQKNSSK